MIIVSANAPVGSGVYPRPNQDGITPSPTMAKTMLNTENDFF